MVETQYSTEIRMRVYNDATGEYIQVGPDSDGLELVEIASFDRNGKVESSGQARVTMPVDQAKQVSAALVKYLAELEPKT